MPEPPVPLPAASVAARLARARAWSDGLARGRLGVPVRATRAYLEAGGPLIAAGLAYYALFALLPLLLVLLLLVGRVLTAEMALVLVQRLAEGLLPLTSAETVIRNLQDLGVLWGPLGLLAGLGILWSATTGLAVLVEGVDHAFHRPSGSAMVRNRLKGLSIVLGLGLFLVGALVASVLIRLLADRGLAGAGTARTLADVLSWLLPVVGLVALYRWGPSIRPRWLAVVRAALVAGLTWRVALTVFGGFMGSGLSRYQIVYGTLTGAIVLLLWLYVSASIVLFGAHLCAAQVIVPEE